VKAPSGQLLANLLKVLGTAGFTGKVIVDVANANANTPSFELVYPDSSIAGAAYHKRLKEDGVRR
jgi:hypothetical protein